jgi:Predicted transcriptional regulators
MSIVGERLKYLREKYKVKQNQLAKELGIHNSTLAKYESGEREPDLETLNKVTELFRVSVDWLLGRTDDPVGINPEQPYYLEISKNTSLRLDEESFITLLQQIKKYENTDAFKKVFGPILKVENKDALR